VELANEIEYGFNAVKMIFAQARNIRQEHITDGDNLELAKGEVARVRALRGHPQRRALELFQAVGIAQEVLDEIEERATTSTAHHSDNRTKSVLERAIKDLDAGQIRCLADSVEVDLGAIEEAYLANWSGLVPTSGSAAGEPASSRTPRKAKLGEIKLPYWMPGPDQGQGASTFYEFLQPYKMLVHEDPDLTDLERFMRLRNHLGPIPYKKIEMIPLVGSCYKTALQRLIFIYGQEEEQERVLLNQIKTLPMVRSMSSLRAFHDRSEEILVRLSHYNKTVNEDTTAILNDLESKIAMDELQKLKTSWRTYQLQKTLKNLTAGEPSTSSTRLSAMMGIDPEERKAYEEWCVGALREAVKATVKEFQHELTIKATGLTAGARKPAYSWQNPQGQFPSSRRQRTPEPGTYRAQGLVMRARGRGQPLRGPTRQPLPRTQQPPKTRAYAQPSAQLANPRSGQKTFEAQTLTAQGQAKGPGSKPTKVEPRKPAFNPENRKLVCKLCDQNHITANCPTYPTKLDRYREALAKNRCQRCLRTGHEIKNAILSCKAVVTAKGLTT